MVCQAPLTDTEENWYWE